MKKRVILLSALIAGYSAFAQTDCTDALVVCGNTNFEGLHLDGSGALQEVSSCGSEEHNSLWLKIHIHTSGTLAFTIVPQSSSLQEDYDFFLFSYNSCDDYYQIRCSTTHPQSAGLSYNLTGTNDSETDDFEGPGPDGDSFVRSVDALAGETYMLVIDRPGGNSDFSLEWTGTATFNDPPSIAPLPSNIATLDLSACDADGNPDHFTSFDLTRNTPLIAGSQPDMSVHYYLSQSDSLIGANEIQDPQAFVNTENPQTIYVRLENDVTECFANTAFLIQTDATIALATDRFAICDDGSDGDAFNGQTAINMADVTQTIFPGQPGFAIRYFLNRQDARDNINPIGGTFYNTTPDQQTVYIRGDDGSCTFIFPVQLLVRYIPPVQAATLVQCDYGANPDGMTTFDLSEANVIFTGADPDYSVAYFKDMAAMAANDPLPAVYDNQANPQSVLVRITDALTGCDAENVLSLQVNTVTAQSLVPLKGCDVNGNGITSFDLSSANVALLAQEHAAYYRNLQDALLQQNPIQNTSGYSNAVAYQDAVFVRIDDAVNGCSGISELRLEVNPLPVIDSDIVAKFCPNIPGAYVTIDAGQLPPGTFTFIWHFNNALLPDTTYAVDAGQAGTYAVDIVNEEGCLKTRTISVVPAAVPVIQSVTTEGHTAIVNLAAGLAGNFGYSLDQPDGPFQAGNVLADVPCGLHTAYVDGGNGCGATGFAFEVTGIPTYFSPNGDGFADRWNVLCGAAYPGAILSIFDRYGKLIKQIDASGPGWDGTYNGHLLPSGDYWYVMTPASGPSIKGHFALKR